MTVLQSMNANILVYAYGIWSEGDVTNDQPDVFFFMTLLATTSNVMNKIKRVGLYIQMIWVPFHKSSYNGGKVPKSDGRYISVLHLKLISL